MQPTKPKKLEKIVYEEEIDCDSEPEKEKETYTLLEVEIELEPEEKEDKEITEQNSRLEKQHQWLNNKSYLKKER